MIKIEETKLEALANAVAEDVRKKVEETSVDWCREDDCQKEWYSYEDDEYYFDIIVTIDVLCVDDSFDHPFGTYYDYHYELGDISDVYIEGGVKSVINEDGDEDEVEVDCKELEAELYNLLVA